MDKLEQLARARGFLQKPPPPPKMDIEFFLDDQASRLITSLKNIQHNEFELRFFKTFGVDKTFKPSISEHDFNVIRNALINKKYKEVFSKSTVEIFILQNGQKLRRITESGKHPIYETKKSVQNYDTLYQDFNLRFSLSTETVVEDPHINFRPEIVRTRFRYEYVYLNEYKYVLTVVIDDKNVRTFELEIEFVKIVEDSKIVRRAIEVILPYIIADNNRVTYLPNSLTQYLRKFKDELFSHSRIKEVKPQNLTRKETPELQSSGYSVTNKLDGEHFFIISCEKGLFAINNRLVDMLKVLPMNNTILDAELYKGNFNVFDAMMIRGKNIMDIPHLERLKISEEIIDQFELVAEYDVSFRLKTFSKNLVDFSNFFLNNPENMKDNDGLIYTSEFGEDAKKWKYPEKMTLDFLLRYDGETRPGQPKFFVYKLYLGESQGRIVDFQGTREFPLRHPNVYFSSQPLINNGIYELGYDKTQQKFIMFRNRPDKNIPNYYPTTGASVWNDMMNPYTKMELIDLLKVGNIPLVEYRKYHNNIKRNIINSYCDGKKVLDLGAGNGGDLGKYEKIGIEYLWAVEPYQKNYEEFKRRLSSSFKGLGDKTTLIIAKAQETQKIIDGMKGVLADIVSSFFSLSFFFFNQEDLTQLVNTISSTLRRGGLFIGTTIDGKRLKRLLQENSGKYVFEGGSYELLDDNTIQVIMEGTIVQTQVESLVDFKLLKTKLNSSGFVLRETHYFEDNSKLSVSENKINSLYRTFVFEKKNSDCDDVLKYVYGYCSNIGIQNPQKYTVVELLGKIKNHHMNFVHSYNSKVNLVDKIIKKYISTIEEEDVHFPSNIPKDYTSFDYSKFVIDPETSVYSCLMPYQVAPVRNAFRFIDQSKILRIVDATGNVGVDDVNFSQMFPKASIETYEIVPRIFKKLEKNIAIFGLQDRVKVYNDDFTKIFGTISGADIVYIDAPFGGPQYKESKSLSLYLQKEGEKPDENKNVLNVARELVGKNRYVVLKVPFNFQQDYRGYFSGFNIIEKDIKVKERVQFKLIFITKK
jgi:hypothetical protein